jgi:hypothetical protein
MLAELVKLKTGFLTHVIFPSAYGSIFFEPNCIATILHRCHARLYCNLCFGLAVLAPGRVKGTLNLPKDLKLVHFLQYAAIDYNAKFAGNLQGQSSKVFEITLFSFTSFLLLREA